MRQLTFSRRVVSTCTKPKAINTLAIATTSKREVEQSAILELVEVVTKGRVSYVRRVLVLLTMLCKQLLI